ncbi:uncharacterized protein [Apostichopus japonicus]|uniref:uncharacterized protein n=1 Tax=Stichopus japonicus TaxID=307972 RepID=UPI003AB45C3D
MLIVRLFRYEARKVVVFKEFRDLIETAKKKFKIAVDVVLVDKEDGAEIDEDSFVPSTAIVVLKRLGGEKWDTLHPRSQKENMQLVFVNLFENLKKPVHQHVMYRSFL